MTHSNTTTGFCFDSCLIPSKAYEIYDLYDSNLHNGNELIDPDIKLLSMFCECILQYFDSERMCMQYLITRFILYILNSYTVYSMIEL